MIALIPLTEASDLCVLSRLLETVARETLARTHSEFFGTSAQS